MKRFPIKMGPIAVESLVALAIMSFLIALSVSLSLALVHGLKT